MSKRQRNAVNQRKDLIQLEEFRGNGNRQRNVTILPRNLKQEQYIDLLENEGKSIVFALGPAGTGKTLLATLWAVQELKAGRISKLVMTRPAVSVDEQHGFLPGTLLEKMAPWTRPIFDILEEYWSPKTLASMLEENTIEVAPLAYMRGRTFKDAIVLADEMQNATQEQMKMLLTRLGDNSRIFVTGDLNQHDRGYKDNGLKDFTSRLATQKSRYCGLVEFSAGDVERHPAVAEVLDIYEQA